MLQRYSSFIYDWYIDEYEKEVTCIRIYALDEGNKNVCIRVDDFTPYVYIELPEYISWTPAKSQILGNKIDEIMRSKKPLTKSLQMKKKLYGVYLDHEGKRKTFPYLFCSFSNRNDIRELAFHLKRKVQVAGMGALKLKIHETDANPILQMICCRQIPSCGWVKVVGEKVSEMEKVTLCDIEIKAKWKNLVADDTNQLVPKPKIMGFDIEVNSTNPSAMPKSEKPGDKVFQISCVISRPEEPAENDIKYLLTLGDPDPVVVGTDVTVRPFNNEPDLLDGFTSLVREENPNLIAGYNILGFDIQYMIDRAKMCFCISTFDKQGFHKTQHAQEKTIRWSSSAYKNQEFQYLNAEGRIFVDLLPLVKRDFKFSNYKLKTISEYFIGETKDPLSVKGIFKGYRIGTKTEPDGTYSDAARKAMALVGKYCVQDSALVNRLMDKLKTWVGLSEMAKTCNVPIFTLYTQGQQIKVYSQLYKYCMFNNIVVEKDAYQVDENERYVGAKVFPPIAGQYEMVVPFDFSSLYPTTIIAYNIDYHTWVPDDSDVPDSQCHVMDWQDCQNCQHDPKVQRKIELGNYIDLVKDRIKKLREKRNSIRDKALKKKLAEEIDRENEELKPYIQERSDVVKTIGKAVICTKRKYKFIKEPKGVLPTILQNLLDARSHTRKVHMKKCKETIAELKKEEGKEDEIKSQMSLLDVLDKRQLSYKVSCNSMYGIMGVKKGYLPFMIGAMATTYMGRVNIEVVAETIPKKYGGQLVYGDTDSNYIHFPHLKTAQETWDYAEKVAEEVTQLFPRPIVLEFEEEIYSFFFILSKKRYMYRKCLRDGIVDEKIGKKGVLLARRDNSPFIRDIYESVITQISNNVPCNDVVYDVIMRINEMCGGALPRSKFVITKAVGNSGDLQPIPFTNEKNQKKAKVGDYTVPILSSDPNERLGQMQKKGAENEGEFYLLCLPAQVQLAERMRRRGHRVDSGTRLEYVVTDPDRHTAKQYEKVENVDYLSKYSDIVKIDYLYYLKQLVNPLDQVMDVAYKDEPGYKKGFVMEQYKYRYKVRQKLHRELKSLFIPKVIFAN